MPLAPSARTLLDQLAAAGGPRLEDMTVSEARATSAQLWKAFAVPPAPVHAVDDVDADGVQARLYTPVPAGDGDLPVVVHLHGGGWVLGDLDEADLPARSLASASGARVLSVDYRLAPEHPFPAGLDDAMTALRWAAEHLSPPALAVAGESAGGNLAAAAALRARDEGGPALAFQLLAYPVLDARCASGSYDAFGDGHLLTASAMRWFRDLYLSGAPVDPTEPYVSPLLAPDLAGLPPALVVTAECDPLRDEGEAYAARLRDAGIDAVTSRYLGMVHGFTMMSSVFPDACSAFVEETGWALRNALGLALVGPGAEEVAVDGGDEALDRVDHVDRAH